jgi:NAD(P)-dependent dehydrogenase (short-subunit alcohol dehydrogenase family)
MEYTLLRRPVTRHQEIFATSSFINKELFVKDKIVLITGGTGGIGKQTAIALARLGAQVVVTGRDRARGEAGVLDIQRASGSYDVELLLADLSTRDGVRSLADQFKRRYPRLDVLINNAGLLAQERIVTADGLEADFAVNVIAPFLLTHLLLDVLQASAPSRVVNVSGGMSIWGKIDLDNLQAEKSFRGLETYSQTKTVMMALAYEFARRLEGSGVTINVGFPGAASTAMTQALSPSSLPTVMRLTWPVLKSLYMRDDGGKSAAKASQSSVYLATSPEVDGVSGQYFSSSSKPMEWPKDVYDDALRLHLWTLCEQLAQISAVADTPKSARTSR